jgi:PAS domain S-box-containing protein
LCARSQLLTGGWPLSTLKKFTPLLSGVIANLPQAVIVADQYSKIHFANKGAARMFGYSPSEFESFNLDRLIPIENRKKHFHHVKKYILEEKTERSMGTSIRVNASRKGGKVFPVDASISHLNLDGSEPLAMVVITDLSKYIDEDNKNEKLIESTAASSEILTMLDSIEDLVTILDSDWSYLYVNNAALKFNKKKRKDILGSSFWRVYPDLIGSRVENEFKLALQSGKKRSFEYNYAARGKTFKINLIPSSRTLVVHTTDKTDLNKIRHTNKKMMDTLEKVLNVKLIKKSGTTKLR